MIPHFDPTPPVVDTSMAAVEELAWQYGVPVVADSKGFATVRVAGQTFRAVLADVAVSG